MQVDQVVVDLLLVVVEQEIHLLLVLHKEIQEEMQYHFQDIIKQVAVVELLQLEAMDQVLHAITGTATTYAGGGGGGSEIPTGDSPGSGGAGGGGAAGSGAAGSGTSGTANTGGGGGGAQGAPTSSGTSGSGGSGIVIVRAPSTTTFAVSPGTNSTSTHPGGDKIATFTVSGTLTVS